MRFIYTMSVFTSLKRIGNGLDGLFMFKEFEKDVKRRLHDVSLHNVKFYELGKIRKWTQTFDTRFREHDQGVIINTHRPFSFYESMKNP